MLSKMMTIQPQNSLISGNTLNLVEELSKPKTIQEKKLLKASGSKEINNGLRVPGANWEKYKTLITESKLKNKDSGESTMIKSPRKRQRPKKINNRLENLQVCIPK